MKNRRGQGEKTTLTIRLSAADKASILSAATEAYQTIGDFMVKASIERIRREKMKCADCERAKDKT